MLVWQGSQAFTIACRSSRYLHKAVNRENLSSTEAQMVMELILSGEASTAQIACVPCRAADERRDCRTNWLALRARCGRKSHEGEGRHHGRAAARYLRNRRRWRVYVQHLNCCGVCCRGRRRESRQAREPVAFEPMRQRRHPRSSGRQHCAHTGADRQIAFARSASDSCSLPRCIPP